MGIAGHGKAMSVSWLEYHERFHAKKHSDLHHTSSPHSAAKGAEGFYQR